MSDFLTNLAARALAPPTLRPRIRSRFEPAPEEPPAPEWPAATPRVQRASASAERRLPAGRSAAFQAATSEVRRQRLHFPNEPESESGGDASALQTITHLSREVEHDVERIVETRERVVRVPERIETEREVVRHRYETQPPRVLHEQSPEVHHHRETRITTERAPRVIASAPQPTTAEAAEPTVHVSIGRIEVRAVAQPQQPAQREPKRGMTIDDYVARRKAKERR